MVKVMTYNIHNYDDGSNWNERLSIIIGVIAQHKPDIIALQEIRFDPDQDTTQSSYQNMGEQILYGLNKQNLYQGSALVFQPRMYYPSMLSERSADYRYYPLPSSISGADQSDKWEGPTIISRLKISETGYRFLTNVDRERDLNTLTGFRKIDPNMRTVQYASFKTESGTPLYVFNCHYSYDLTNFLFNVKETLEYMTPFNDKACLLLGDLNQSPENGVKGFQKFSDAGLYDLWKLKHPGEEGYTAPFDTPPQRIDYIWANSMIPTESINCIGRVGMEPVKLEPGSPPVYASDHLGLMTSINI